MKTPIHKRLLSLLLVLALAFPLIPHEVFAETQSGSVDTSLSTSAETPPVSAVDAVLNEADIPDAIDIDRARARGHVRRLLDEEGENLNNMIFENADGSRTMYLFDYPVKYIDDNGQIKDISLKITDHSDPDHPFRSASADAETIFSRDLSDGITLSDDRRTLRLVPNQGEGKQATRLDENTVSYPYGEHTSIEYALTYTGFKEDIVVSQYTGQTEYSFTLYTHGLTLSQIDGSWYMTDASGNIQASVGDIIVFTADERNNTLGQLRAETVIPNQEYLMTIVLDPEYLSDPDTLYPIRIDPSIELNYDNNGADAIVDLTINTNSVSSITSGSLYVGVRETQGIARVLMRFPGLTLSGLTGAEVTSATVELRDLMCESTYLPVFCYPYTGTDWDSSSSWSTLTQSYGPQLSVNTISYANGVNLDSAHRYSFDITAAVQGWIDGNYDQDKGIIFTTYSGIENTSTNDHRTFASYNRASHKPSLSVTYTNSETKLIADGTYYINNKYFGKYLQNTSSGVNATSGLLSTLGSTIRWKVQKVSDGYVIRLASDPTKYLAVPETTTSSYVGLVSVSDSSLPQRCIWSISYAAYGDYLITNTYNSRVLCFNGTSIMTAPDCSTSNYNIYVWRFANISTYGNTSSHTYRELTSNSKFSNLELPLEGTGTITLNKYYSSELWTSIADFTITIANTDVATLNGYTITGKKYGGTLVTATHRVTNLQFTFYVIVGFSSSLAETPLAGNITEALNAPYDIWPAGEESMFYGYSDTARLDALIEITQRAIITEVGGSLLGFNTAADMLQHYLDNTGSLYLLNLNDMISDWQFAKDNFINHLTILAQITESCSSSTSNTIRTIVPIGCNGEGQGGYWGYAINSYSISITCTYQKTSTSTYSMVVIYDLHDAYDWDPDNTDMGIIPVSPAEMWELHYAGYSRNYEVYGSVRYEFSWTVGDFDNAITEVFS